MHEDDWLTKKTNYGGQGTAIDTIDVIEKDQLVIWPY